jgi:PAS domain S-box-containing protein
MTKATNITSQNTISALTVQPVRQPRILVVDDQSINIQTLYQTFSGDYQVFMATSGEQALAVCLASQPDLVLLDVVMPDMDGYEVLRRLRADPALSEIPVIFITASTDEQSEVRGLNAGAVDFIYKPINPQIVRARVSTHLTLLAQKLALQESKQYTQAILDNAADGIVTSDGQGVIGAVNHAVENIFGYHCTELIGTDIGMLLAEPYREQYASYLHDADASASASAVAVAGFKKELEGRHKDGHCFPIELSLSQSMHHGQTMVVALMRDISERRRIEQMKTDFISTVSHELRTPLTSISGALGLVVAGVIGAIPPAMMTMIEMAHKNSLRLSHLINDLLDMEKMLAGKLQFDFKIQPVMPLIESAIESTRAYAERLNVDFCITERLDDVRVNVDGDRLHQVLVNLLSNAAKFSPPGQQVQIAVQLATDRVRVSVIDHGSGIPLQFRDRIFQKFAQADASNTRSKGGTGLGLAIAQEMMVRMHGEIGFVSEEGAGACFYFDLPQAFC